MDGDFWRKKWRDNQLGWHRDTPHPMLLRHLSALALGPGARVFVPLCGKSVDIGWLLGCGFRVTGIELVETAVAQLFATLGLSPDIRSAGPLKRYVAKDIDIFAGDLFDLDADTLGPVDAVYDRAALVALPPDMRARYAAHLVDIAGNASQLLITFTYDQTLMQGPPFSVTGEEARALYAGAYELERLDSAGVEGGLKGVCPAIETVWRLSQTR